MNDWVWIKYIIFLVAQIFMSSFRSSNHHKTLLDTQESTTYVERLGTTFLQKRVLFQGYHRNGYIFIVDKNEPLTASF